MPVREVRAADAPRIAAIYNHYVRESVVTFEEEPATDAEMARRIAETAASYPWLVCETGGELVGYAYASSWKRRSAYRYAAMRGHGLHAAIGGISLPNPASVALHEKLGFVPIGRFSQVGFKFGRWVDVGYWELTFA